VWCQLLPPLFVPTYQTMQVCVYARARTHTHTYTHTHAHTHTHTHTHARIHTHTRTHTHTHTHRKMNVGIVNRNVFMPVSKLRLSLYRFSLKSHVLYNVLGKTPIPNSMKKRQTSKRRVSTLGLPVLLRKKGLTNL
jgi:hypothetical protein